MILPTATVMRRNQKIWFAGLLVQLCLTGMIAADSRTRTWINPGFWNTRPFVTMNCLLPRTGRENIPAKMPAYVCIHCVICKLINVITQTSWLTVTANAKTYLPDWCRDKYQAVILSPGRDRLGLR
ncbi:hypothetical protein LZ32DRAFT_94772 [Colletotrichum eremochloae]|nr:hypothetical protein LZ32DRAFT_94772 [Colletotrichum eremochloae]